MAGLGGVDMAILAEMEPRPRGRVALADRAAHEAALVEAATTLFLERGFGGTSIDMLARAARVSPKTIYARHGGKAGLFASVMRELSVEALSPFRELALGDAPPEAALPEFGRRYLALVLSGTSVAMQRAVIAEAARFPEFARIFYDEGPRRGLEFLADYLRGCAARGSLAIGDPDLAAEAFVALLGGELARRAVLNIAETASPAAAASRLEQAVRIFLIAHAPGAN